MPPQDAGQSPLAPLRHRVFRMLWGCWLTANLCMWMNDVAAAWLMTSLTASPVLVALVQTAATLPVFLLGLPSGALADAIDRRKYLLSTQLWVAVVACALSAVVFFGVVNPVLLLALVFANGVGLAMRWPVFAAIVPELVPRPQLPAALALNAVSMNASRIAGPLLAGALIAAAGSAWVFALNAALSLGAALVISRWRREHRPHPLGPEPLLTAMRVGLQYVSQSRPIRGVLLRVGILFFHSTALTALLPLLARDLRGGSAASFTLLLAAMGIGAIAAAWVLPALRRRHARDALVLRGAMLQSAAMGVIAWTDSLWVALPAMLLAGCAWIVSVNTLSVAIQLQLPDWVRARGMSTYQMVIMGSSAAGAATWGQLAGWSGVHASLLTAASAGIVAYALARRWLPDAAADPDVSPRRLFDAPEHSEPPARGRVLLSVEYLIDPARAAEFRRLMFDESRPSRLRQGALSWELLHDLNEPGRFVEEVVDQSWTDYLRRFDRVTAADAELHARKLAFHIGAEPPRLSRCLLESTVRED